MKIYSQNWMLSKAIFILTILLISSIGTAGFYYMSDEPNKSATLLAGFVVSLPLILLQFLFSWSEHVERESYRLLGLKKVLPSKKEMEYYGKLIKKAKTKIDLMGRTCSHFLEDFANSGGGHTETNFLYEALGRNVRVRFLLPNPDLLDDKHKLTAIASRKQLEELQTEYGNFNFRYFNHVENHSIFLADDDVILGPFFPNQRSMDTPALHLNSSANLPSKYIEYFQQEWDLCKNPE